MKSVSLWRIATDASAYEAHDMTGKGAEISGGAGTVRASRLSTPPQALPWPLWRRLFTWTLGSCPSTAIWLR